MLHCALLSDTRARNKPCAIVRAWVFTQFLGSVRVAMKWSESQTGSALARQWAPLRVWLRAYGPAHHHIDYEQALRGCAGAVQAAPVEVFEADDSKRVNPGVAGMRVTFLGLHYGLRRRRGHGAVAAHRRPRLAGDVLPGVPGYSG